MVKRYEHTPIYVVVRVDPRRKAVDDAKAIEAFPTIGEAWSERDRLNALAAQRGWDHVYSVSRCRWYPYE